MSSLDRPEKSAAEIAAIVTLGTTQSHAYVRDHGAELSAETLICIMRGAKQRQDTALFELAGVFLLGRPGSDGRWTGGHCESVLAKLANTFGFRDQLERRVEYRSQCITELMRAIHAGTDKKPYWEERFGDAFRKACIDAARSMVRDERVALGQDLVGEDDTDWDDGVPDPRTDDANDDALTRLARQDRDSRLLNAVRLLPPRQSQAVLLHYFEERAIAGQSADSVAAVMGISETAVHKHLAKARARLRADTNLLPIWPEGR
jgi:RNA polymerase sigma factor (sigma-70 family)